VRHYVDTDSFAQASELLESVFANYPDAAFLDEMLLLWANVAYRMGDSATAMAKLRQLIFDYPTSQHIEEARKKLAALESEGGAKPAPDAGAPAAGETGKPADAPKPGSAQP
jgi:outer membrane protein assembly factor BamD (BamD/ComL family)